MDPGEQTDQGKSPVQPAPANESEGVGSAPEDLSTVPESSGRTTMVAVPVDPHVVHCQWEIAPADLEAAKQALGVREHEYWPVLRFYDVTNTPGNDLPRYPSFSEEVQLGTGNWYVRSCNPERSYRADLAVKREDGSIAVIASSERVETPPAGPSNYADEHWLPIRLSPESAAPAGAPVRWPVDMSEEVANRLRALYGVNEQGLEPSPQRQPGADKGENARGGLADVRDYKEPESASTAGQPSLPVDMREEVSKVLSQLYEGLEQEPFAPDRGPLKMEGFRMQRAGSGSYALAADTPADLTEWNERTFTSGISSR